MWINLLIFFLFCCAPIVAWMLYRILQWTLTVYGSTPTFHRHRYGRWGSISREIGLYSPMFGRTQHTEWRQSQACTVDGCGYAREIRMEITPR